MSGRAALVTGASTGIGRATSLFLARSGFRVYGGVRRQADAEALAAAADGVGDLQPLIIDVTDEPAIGAAARRIQEDCGEAGLRALVNNAGAAYVGPLEFVPLEDFRKQLEVNLVGQLAVTQALLPALRTGGGGRIVNVTSIGGLVSTPFYGPYCASKFAFESVSDCLRTELRPWGIDTVAIEPGSIATEIWTRGTEIANEMRGRMPAEAEALYGEAIDATERISAETGARGIHPDEVARTIHKAITVRRPRARYRVGRDAKAMTTASRMLPDRIWDRLVARTLKLP